MGQRQRSGDYPNYRQGCVEAKEPHRRDATHGWRPAIQSRSRRGSRLCLGNWSPEAELICYRALVTRCGPCQTESCRARLCAIDGLPTLTPELLKLIEKASTKRLKD